MIKNMMKSKALTWVCFAFLLNPTLGASQEFTPPETISNPAIESALQSEVGPGERMTLSGIVQAELEPGLKGAETVVVWTLLGGTYWSTHLSVLNGTGNSYKVIASLSLDGAEAKLESVADGLINLTAKTPGPNDPICCPSQQTTLHYRYGKGQLIDVKGQ